MSEGKSSGGGGSSSGESKKGGVTFTIKKWNAVAFWSWDIYTDTCAICRNALHGPSIEYQVRDSHSLASRASDVSLPVLSWFFSPFIFFFT